MDPLPPTLQIQAEIAILPSMNKAKLLAAGLAAAMTATAVAAPATDQRVPFADPFILLDGDVYYAYGTSSPNGIAVATSRDLKHWKKDAGRADGHLALHKNDSYGERHFWAPEVYRVNGKYIMYYSAEEHTCAATADHPCGPFRQLEQKPLMSDMKTIDNSLFFDKDGRPWMAFVNIVGGNRIWVAQMEADCLHVKPGTRREILRASEPWELKDPKCHVVEGPFVIYEKGVYILTYSANSYENPDYAVGYATAKSPEGPWTKAKANPILRRRGGVGTGHHSLFRDKSGRWRIVYHVHDHKGKIHPRRMLVADFQISGANGAPKPRVSGTTVVCEWKKSP